MGPDVCIEAVGLHYSKRPWHKIEMALHLESDSPEVGGCASCWTRSWLK
jgi:hypothetical protein